MIAPRRDARPPGRFPRHLEAQYLRRLHRRLATLRQLLTERLPELRRDGAPDRRRDEDGWPARISLTVRAVRQVWEVMFPPDPESLAPLALAIDTFTTGQTQRQLERIVTIDPSHQGRLSRLHLEWVRENVALIRSLEGDFFDALAADITRAVHEGRSDLVAVLRHRYRASQSRAATIARTEVARLNSQITEHRQKEVGVDRYVWSSSDDARVRPEHAALDGTVRRWDDPHPTEIHPGRTPNCRCVALPYFDDED